MECDPGCSNCFQIFISNNFQFPSEFQTLQIVQLAVSQRAYSVVYLAFPFHMLRSSNQENNPITS